MKPVQKTTIKGILINVSRGKTLVEVAYKQIKDIMDSNKQDGSLVAYQQGRNDLLREIMEEMPKVNLLSWVPLPKPPIEVSFSGGVDELCVVYPTSLVQANIKDQVNTLLESKLSRVKK